MNVLRSAKRIVGDVLKSTAAHRASLLAATRSARPGTVAHHLLVCPPGAGNLGDQALVEAFLENTEGRVTLVVRRSEDFAIPDAQRARVHIVAMPDLLYGRIPSSTRDSVRFGRLLDGATSLSVVGADTMDGAYNLRASINRAAIAEVAARRGIDARVLGFSWNAAPHPAALRQLGVAAQHGVDLFLRDPRSESRARADGLGRVHAAADIVFSAKTIDEGLAAEWVAKFDDPGRPLALVNVSGLIRKQASLATEYAAVIQHLRVDHNVLLLPHVVKRDSDDLEASREVLALVEDSGEVQLVVDRPTPAQVRGFCRAAASIVTGRMHLAVNALLQGRMPVVLATQGKVEGLMELFGAPDLCIEPKPGMAASIIDQVEWARERSSTEHLSHVRSLSAANFGGLASAPVARP